MEKSDFQKTFAETGHATLKAFLTVSSGAAVSFLVFLGNTFDSESTLKAMGSRAASGLVLALQLFVVSVALSVLAFGTSFFSHAAYYFGKKSLGTWLTVATSVVLISVLSLFGIACYSAAGALKVGVANLMKGYPSGVSPRGGSDSCL